MSNRDISVDELKPYLSMPLPPFNPYIKNSLVTEADRRNEIKAPKISSTKLVKHVLLARDEVMQTVGTLKELASIHLPDRQ